MEDEKLIELVRQNPFLYDSTHPKYMDPKLKSSVWENIGLKLNTSDIHCKSRWTNIRDHFRRHLGKRLNKTGQPAGNVKKYKYEEILQFLLPHLNEKSFLPEPTKIPSLEGEDSYSNEEDYFMNPQVKYEEECDKQVEGNERTEECSQPAYEPENPLVLITETTSRRPLKRKSPITESPSSLLIKYMIDKNRTADNKAGNPIDAFLNGIGATLKRFSPYHQCLAKEKIFSVVHELELQQLENYQY